MKHVQVFLPLNVCFLTRLLSLFLAGGSLLGEEIEFGLVDKESGHPISGGRVILEYEGSTGSDIKKELEIPSNGRVVFKGGFSGSSVVRVEFQSDGFVPLAFRYRGKGGKGFVGPGDSVAVSRSAYLRGRVLNIDGEPIEGVSLHFSVPQKLSGPRIPLSRLRLKSNPEGRWETNAIGKSAGYVRVEAHHPEFDPLPVAEEDIRRALSDGSDLIITMKGFQRISGIVSDPEGNPVELATVTLGNQHGVSGMGDYPSVQTDAEGRFVFERVECGSRVLFAQAENWAPSIESVDVKKGTNDVVLQLQKGVTTQFLVTDMEDQPLSGVQVRVSQWERSRYPGWDFRTNEMGRFEWENSPNGVVAVDFVKAGYMALIRYSVTTGGEEQHIRLGPELKVVGKVFDAETGEPVSAFSLVQGIPRESFDSSGNRIVSGASWLKHTEKRYRDGQFSLTFSRPIVAGTREPMDFLFRVEADGYETSVSPQVEAGAREAELVFELRKGGLIGGRIVAPSGAVLEEPSLFASEERFGLFVENGKVQTRFRGIEKVPVNSDGTFEMREPTEIATIIALSDQGYRVTDSNQLRNGKALGLISWSTIEGRLMLGKQPGAGEKVALWFAEGYAERDHRVAPVIHRFRGYETVCDAAGRFQFTRVPAGEMSIAHVIQPERPMGTSTTGNEVWGSNRLHTLNVEPGSRQVVEVGGRGVNFKGRIKIPEEITDQVQLPVSRFYLSPLDASLPVVEGESMEERQKNMKRAFWSNEYQSKRHWFGGTPVLRSGGGIHGRMIGWRLFPDDEGRFELWNVPPGDYELYVMFSRMENMGRMRQAMMLGSFRTEISIPRAEVYEAGEIAGTFEPSGSNVLLHPYLMRQQRHQQSGVVRDSGGIGRLARELPSPAKPSVEKKVSFSVGTRPKAGQSNVPLMAIVRLQILEGHHIYSIADSVENRKTTLTLELPEGFEAVGEWHGPAPRKKARNMIYEGEAAFGHFIKIADDTEPGTYTFPVHVKYQICDDAVCWPPDSKRLDISVVVE